MRGKWAWKRLVRVGDRGGQHAIEAVQRAWLRRPDEEGWQALGQWRAAADLASAVFAAAVEPDRPAPQRAALGAFCARKCLAPGEAVSRTSFFALTGQPAQRRALDPDGALLAAAYRAADERTRAALRELLAGAGDLDVVRVVAGARPKSGVTGMTAAEREYLTGQLADRRDWAGLWRLAQDLPLLDAVTAVHLISDRWRPPGQRERELFGLLARAGPEAVRGMRDALRANSVTGVEVPGQIVAGALSPRGHRLAVLTTDWAGPVYSSDEEAAPRPATISVFDLPRGRLVAEYSMTIRTYGHVVYAGPMLIVGDSYSPSSGPGETLLYRCLDVQPMQVAFRGNRAIYAIVARGRGFAGVYRNGVGLSFHRSDGTRSGTYMGAERALRRPVAIASDVRSGRLAVLSGRPTPVNGRHVVLFEAQRVSVIGELYGEHQMGICFHGPRQVITASEQGIERWRVDVTAGGWLLREAWANLRGSRCPVLIPARNEICVLHQDRYEPGKVTYLDADTLEPAGGPRELTGRTGTALWSSPGNTCYALGGDGFVDVVTREGLALQALVDRPLAAWQPKDVTTARKAAPVAERYRNAWPLYDLLRGCLAFRFGSEVRLGRSVNAASGASGSAIADDAIGISVISPEVEGLT